MYPFRINTFLPVRKSVAIFLLSGDSSVACLGLTYIVGLLQSVALQLHGKFIQVSAHLNELQTPLVAKGSLQFVCLVVVVLIQCGTLWRIVLVSDVQGTYHAFHLRQIHIAQHVNRNQIVRVNDKANVIVKVGVNAIYD